MPVAWYRGDEAVPVRFVGVGSLSRYELDLFRIARDRLAAPAN